MLREVKAVLADTDIEAKSSLFLSVNGYESKGAEPLVAAMEEAHEYVRGRKVEPIRNAFTSTYADLTVFAEVGIPAIKCGPSPEAADSKPATGEMQKVDDLHGRGADVRVRRPGDCQPRPGVSPPVAFVTNTNRSGFLLSGRGRVSNPSPTPCQCALPATKSPWQRNVGAGFKPARARDV